MVGGNKNIWIVANWKSNKTIPEALEWISQVGSEIPRDENLKVVVCPSFSCLSELKKTIDRGGFKVMLGSQDLSPFGVGSYTGEEAAPLLKELVELSIIGHSEKRKNFGESDEMISKKVHQALENNIIPLVCIQGADTPMPEGCKLVAYEPIFAIGTGVADTSENANKVAGELKQKYGTDLEVLYGGSVTEANIKDFLSQDNISGCLIGRSSLSAEEFVRIIRL